MSDPDASGRVSRRRVLLGAAGIGAAASGGSRTAALLGDEERFRGAVSAGSLDLDVSWDGDGSDPDLGSLREVGENRRRRLSISMSEGGNPGYVWVRTGCPRDLDVEEAVRVSFELDTEPGTDAGAQDLFAGTLREARTAFGPGQLLDGVLSPGQRWELVVTWELVEPIGGETDVEFRFDFHAVQTRHVVDPGAVAPDWKCDTAGTAAISWVAFGGTDPVDITDLTFSLENATTLDYDLGPASESVSAIALKYGTSLDLFDPVDGSGRVEAGAGTGETYEQRGPTFEGTDPTRSNKEPFPEYCWTYKYDVDDGDGETRNGCEA